MTDRDDDYTVEAYNRDIDAQENEEASMERCPDCNHTLNVHTERTNNGAGGCAYCKCPHVYAEGKRVR